MTRNRESIGIIVGAVLAAAGIAGLVLPSLLGADMMRFGYGVGAFGLFLLISGAVVLAFYVARFMLMQRMLSGDNLLAHWQIEPTAWRGHLEQEYARQQAQKRGLFWLVIVLMVVIGAPFVFLDPEAGVWVVAVLAATALLIAFAAFLVPRLALRRITRQEGEILIAAEGLSVGGQLTVWKALGSRLVRVELTTEPSAVLEFEVGYLSRVGYDTVVVRVPVPPGEEGQAKRVVAALSAKGQRRRGRRLEQQVPEQE